MVDDALVACAERSYCHLVDRGVMHRVTGEKAAAVVKKKRDAKNPGRGSVDLQVGHGLKIKLHENGPWDGVTAGLAMLSALHGLKSGPG